MCCFQEFSRMSVARLLLHFYTMNQVLFEDVPCSHLKKKKTIGRKKSFDFFLSVSYKGNL